MVRVVKSLSRRHPGKVFSTTGCRNLPNASQECKHLPHGVAPNGRMERWLWMMSRRGGGRRFFGNRNVPSYHHSKQPLDLVHRFKSGVCPLYFWKNKIVKGTEYNITLGIKKYCNRLFSLERSRTISRNSLKGLTFQSRLSARRIHSQRSLVCSELVPHVYTLSSSLRSVLISSHLLLYLPGMLFLWQVPNKVLD